MEEETEAKQTKEEEKKSFLKEVKEERIALEAIRDANKQIVEELKELRAKEIISGDTSAGQPKEKPKEETPEEYSNKLISGKIKNPELE
ncbi:MAG: hypothetical protein ACTSQE_14715 [Candidatus Heimdallarchaeaceae archaeon]